MLSARLPSRLLLRRRDPNKNAQNIYKTHLDFASPLAYSKNLKKSNTTVHTVGTIKGMDSPVSTHSIDQFSPTPLTVHADGTVSVKRQTAKQSIKNGIKDTVTYHPVGSAVVSVTDRLPSLAHGVIDTGASASKMTTHLGVNVALDEEQAVVDEMIVDASLALAPENGSQYSRRCRGCVSPSRRWELGREARR